MGEKGGALLLIVGVVALFVFLFAGKISPAIDAKGDAVITEIGTTSTSTVD